MAARILVVEDNEANIELVDYVLTAHGFAPLLASTGEEGVRMAGATPPDLILLDIGLPGMDGYEVAAAIREQPACEHTRIVAVTASSMGDRERIAAAGFDGYIPKPIDPATFIAEIEPFLPDGTGG
ncbi:MAG TPA: response regulator [Solirubrobacteraceae bacterium]|nr:response regulator [Solirubrobacteraceae bacterium]